MVANKCENSANIVPATAPSDVIYKVGVPAVTTSFDAFTADLTADPSFTWYALCPWTYASAVSPDLPGPHLVYDASARQHTIETSDVTLTGVYTVTVTMLRPSSAVSTFTLSFTITIEEPCGAATFTFDPSIFPDPYEYVVTQPADVHTILDSLVISSETEAVCPDIVFSFEKRGGGKFDASIFDYDETLQTLSTYTVSRQKIGVHLLTMYAQYVGDNYSVAGTYDFEVHLIDPCLDHATLTPQAQTDPADYYYSGNTPAA